MLEENAEQLASAPDTDEQKGERAEKERAKRGALIEKREMFKLEELVCVAIRCFYVFVVFCKSMLVGLSVDRFGNCWPLLGIRRRASRTINWEGVKIIELPVIALPAECHQVVAPRSRLSRSSSDLCLVRQAMAWNDLKWLEMNPKCTKCLGWLWASWLIISISLFYFTLWISNFEFQNLFKPHTHCKYRKLSSSLTALFEDITEPPSWWFSNLFVDPTTNNTKILISC